MGSFLITRYYEKVRAFESEALKLLSKFDAPVARIYTLSETRKKLTALSLTQHSLFDQSIRCAEFGFSRPSIVMGWAAFVSYYEMKLSSNIKRIHSERPKWAKFTSIDEIAENIVEYQLIELGRDLGLFQKGEMKSILGLLSKRNECAHPSSREPSINEAIGYISELLDRISKLVPKVI
jgi:hypothetical protein